MHLMVFDPHDRGHYLTYVRYLLSGAAPAKRVTVVLRKGAKDSEAFRTQLMPWLGTATLDTAIGDDSYLDGGRLVKDFSRACQTHRPDHVWVPGADTLALGSGLAHALGRFHIPSGIEVECGLIEIGFHHRPKRWRGHIRQFLHRTALRTGPWFGLHTIDPTAFAWLQARTPRLARRFSLVPDPVDDFTPISKRAAREVLGVPVEGRYVGSVGSHAILRKGSALLVEAFARAKLAQSDRLLLAGPLGDSLATRLRNEFGHLVRAGRIVTVDRYLENDEVMQALAAMDVVCAPYIGHLGSSGIVLRAAQAERPVLTPRQGWFAEMVPRFHLGDTGDILDAAALASALERALEKAEGFRVSAASRRLMEYSSVANFANLWAARLRARLEIPTPVSMRTWDWVLQERK